MAKISLRVYNHEIEGFIEAGQLDEAIAHCHYILKTFPMYVETYRLLGKAFLESRHYSDAADIFQRILMVVPDDFVSHVGMSIIRDDENKLDEAIWHMERAFEVQPSNPAIQGELRRLYGRRDGVEPPKIRLSRDALAYMYAQGDLHNQAIAEIRSVLAEDANRPDLLVMLARSYLRGGQKVQAAETSAGLLKKYPYCMDALRILVDVLPGTAKADNTQVYRQRLVMLDPYASFVAGSVFQSNQVADPAVNLEKLEYKAESVPAASHTDWATSLGIKLGEEHKGTEPQWLSGGQPTEPQPGPTPAAPVESQQPLVSFEPIPVTPEPPPVTFETLEADSGAAPSGTAVLPPAAATTPAAASPASFEPQPSAPVVPAAEPAATPGQAGESIPDWLRAAGWQESTGTASEAPAEMSNEPPAEPLAAAEIPDWLKSMAPPDVAQNLTPAGGRPQPSQAQEPQLFSEDVPEWLKDALPPAETPTRVSEPPAAPPAVAPAAAEPAAPEETKTPPAPPATAPAVPTASLTTQPGSAEQEDDLAWLKSLASDRGGTEEEPPAISQEQTEELPDWLRPAGAGQAGAAPLEPPAPMQAAPVEPEVPVQPAPIEPEVPVQAAQPVSPAIIPPSAPAVMEEKLSPPSEELTPPAAEEAQIPSGGEPQALEPAAAPQEEAPAAPPSQPASKPLGIEDDTLAWLESLAAKQGAKPEELLTKPDQRSEILPDWIQKVVQEQPSDQVPAEPTPHVPEVPPSPPPEVVQAPAEMQSPAPMPEPPVTPAPTEEPETKVEPATVGDDITITSWLSKLDVEETIGKASAGEKAAVPPAEELPDWLRDLEKPAPREEPTFQGESKPEWLSSTAEPVVPESPAAPAQEPTQPEPELPTWGDENAPVTAAPAPTSAEEWVPAEKAGASIPAPEATPQQPPVPAVTPPIPDTQPVRIIFDKSAATPPAVPSPAARPAKGPGPEKDAELLASAQSALQANQLKIAMQTYAKLIKKGRLLEETIHDLREATYRFPVDIIVWQTLGDAYMRANRLQDALDAYNKAEELLR